MINFNKGQLSGVFIPQLRPNGIRYLSELFLTLFWYLINIFFQAIDILL